MAKKKKSFEEECKQVVIEKLESAIADLESIGAASDDADMPDVSGRIFSAIDELNSILEEAKR